MAKNPTIEQDIAQITQGKAYYPGGSGGGGSKRGSGGGVVLPHKKTSPSCKLCHRYHTTAEHARHSRGDVVQAKPRPAAKPKAAKPTVKATKAAKPKATKAAKPKATKPVAIPSTQPNNTLAVTLNAVTHAPAKSRFGPEKVFISEVYRLAKHKLGMSLPAFKEWLIEQNRDQNLDLVRADLVGAMPSHLVRDSEIEDLGATFHFIVDRNARHQRPR